MTDDWMSRQVDPIYGGLVALLWVSMVLSSIYIAAIVFDWGHAQRNASDRMLGLESEVALGVRLKEHEAKELDRLRRDELAREVNPLGVAPALFLISAGALAVLRKQYLDTRAILACIEAGGRPPITPDAPSRR